MSENALSRIRAAISQGPVRAIAISLSVLAICGAAAIFFFSNPEKRQAQQIVEKGHDVVYVCPSCGVSGKLHVVKDAFPMKCPGCGKDTAVRGFVCLTPDCGKTLPALSETFTCTKCGRAYDFRKPDARAK